MVQRLCLYLVPGCILGLLPDALPSENVLLGCCVGGFGTPVVCRPFFGRSLGSSRARTDLGCSCRATFVVTVSLIVIPYSIILMVSAFQSVLVLPPESFLIRLLLVPGVNVPDWCFY